MSDLLKEYRKTMAGDVLRLWAEDAVSEIDRLRAEADALDRVKEIVRIAQKSASDAYEAACRNGDELAQSVCNARVSLLNTISEAMGADA